MKGNKGKKKNKNEAKDNKANKESQNNKDNNKTESNLPKSIQQKDEKIVLTVHAKPGSKKEGICAIDDEYIEIAVHAQAQNNKANVAIIEYLCDIFNLSKNCVTFESGGKNRNKLISLTTKLTPAEVYKILNENLI